jgi:hypothetical protein
MMVRLDRDHVAAELSAVERLLANTPANDFLGRMGLESRRKHLVERLASLAEMVESRAKVALYFGGEPVIGSVGVQAGFATNAVGTFQDLLSKVWGSSAGGTIAAMGPIKDKPASQLHITNLVHGSFGFLLEELDEQGEPMFPTPLRAAAEQAAEYIASFAAEDEHRFSEIIEQINPRVFQSLRQFFGHVYREQATFRMVEGERDERFDRAAVERAWHRVDESSVDEEEMHAQGRLLGVIPMRRRFEFEPDGAQTILEGKVSDDFSHSYLERINNEQIAGKRWRAVFRKRIVAKIGRPPYEAYTLTKLEEIEEPPPGA